MPPSTTAVMLSRLPVCAGVRVAHARAGHQEQAGDAVGDGGDRVDAEQHAVGVDAGQAGGLGVIADRVDGAARGCRAQDEPGDNEQDDHQHRAVGDLRAAHVEGVAEEQQDVGERW